MLTKAQRTIVKHICSIQFKSLTDILIRVDLGKNERGDCYENIFKELGFSRKEFDEELIKTIKNFQEVKKKPDKVYELEEDDITVFVFILNNFQHHWVEQYPKALHNLRNKLFIISMNQKIEKHE